MSDSFLFKELSYSIIGAAFRVHSTLGCGLPEHCYNRALFIELTDSVHVSAVQQKLYDVHYAGSKVGHFFADIVVDNSIILELKSDDRLTASHESQLITYLTISGIRVGYLINFGVASLQFKRLVL